MQISFVTALDPAAVLVLPVEKDGLERTNWGAVSGLRAVAQVAAAAQRFSGETGAIVELFVGADGGVRHVLLLGIGSGAEPDWAKAGGALTAKLLLTAAAAAVDLTGMSATPEAVARFAGAAAQRAWRHDAYRTKLPASARPILARIAISGAPDGTAQAWAPESSVTDGMALTRQLVTEPPNLLCPETFVAQVTQAIDGLGLEVTVLDEAAMRELGMGALLGVSLGSRARPACSRSSGTGTARAPRRWRWSARA